MLDSAEDHQVVELAGEDRNKSIFIKEDGKYRLTRIPQGYGWSGDENIDWSDNFLATAPGANVSQDSDKTVDEGAGTKCQETECQGDRVPRDRVPRN